MFQRTFLLPGQFDKSDTDLGSAEVLEVPQERPRLLASIEYLAEEAKLNKRDPLEHTRASEQALRLFNEQTDEVLVVELLDPTPQERPRLLASREYVFH